MSKIENYSDFEDSLKGYELKNYSSIEQFQGYFNDIAKYILGNVAIVINEGKNRTIYYLEEIEFYYNNLPIKIIESTKGKTITDEEKNKIHHFSCTYKRDKKDGQLFWHYSGVDICFQLYMEQNCYGGILIRSVTKEDTDKNRELITGPLRCANEIMNQCVEKENNSIPRVMEVPRYDNHYEIRSTIRQGIENTKRYGDIIIKNGNEYDVPHDFPRFCYYAERGEEGWYTKGKKYSANPEIRLKDFYNTIKNEKK